MKKIFVIIFLNFFLTTLSQSNEIDDFQISGVSVNNSLLNFIKKDKIIARQNLYKDKGYIYRLKDFYTLTFYNINKFPNSNPGIFFEGLDKYDDIQFHLKHGDDTFKIYAVDGGKHFNSMKKCYDQMKEIESELRSLFKDSKPIKSDKRHSSNKGRSKSSAYWLDKGFIRVSCQDWDEDTKIQDSLVVSVVLEELNIFFDKNYKK